MTTTYDPHHSHYLDEADVRNELSRVFDVCQSCRRCVNHCSSFPTLFEMLDRHHDHDAGRLTPAQQNQIVGECFHCKVCVLNCPYSPGRHEAEVDVPRLMLRAEAMLHATGQVSVRSRATTQVLARTDLLGALGSRTANPTNAVFAAKPGGVVRRVIAKATGVSSRRLLPTFARQRFSTWFKRRPTVRIGKAQGKVALFPTCLVEYLAPSIGHDLVKVYERNGIEVSAMDVGCCGAPWLHSGDREQFIKVAEKNVATLAAEIRAGRDIVVPQPTCGYVVRHDYRAYAPSADAELVAAHTLDAAEFLMRIHRDEETILDMGFDGDVPESIAYHASPHLRAQDIGLRSRDLLKLTGARVRVVQHSSGSEAMWGLRVGNDAIALPVARELAAQIGAAESEIVVGDCHLANIAITEQTGRVPSHPLQVLARAYGIVEEPEP